jgi:hypothetical protein
MMAEFVRASTDIMEIALDTRGIGMQPVPFSGVWYLKIIYFLLYIIVMSFFVTNLFVGVLIDFIGNSDGSALLTESQQANMDLQKFKTLVRNHITCRHWMRSCIIICCTKHRPML